MPLRGEDKGIVHVSNDMEFIPLFLLSFVLRKNISTLLNISIFLVSLLP